MYSKILIATDGSPTAEKAVQVGVGLAKASGSTPVVLHVGDDARGETVLRAVRERFGEVDAVSVPGDAADKIIEVAEQRGADLIVIGNKGMTGAKRFLLGSVPNQVSHHAPCNVFIVKTT